MLEETQNAETRRASTPTQDAAAITSWVVKNQATSPLGLVASFPNDPALVDQAFTYDQALSGIVLLKQGNTSDAQKIFNFYNSQWDGNGYWTVYNTQSVGGTKIEYDRLAGPNAWIALFSLQYYAKTGNSNGLTLATKIGKWMQSLPHQNGGIAMGAGGTFWGNIFSTENNLDYYAVLKILSVKATLQSDRLAFSNELAGVTSWLKYQAYDPVSGLFRRGAGDSIKSLDTNSWAILAIGVDNLKKDFGVSADDLVAKTESNFAVQNDGSFGQNILTAKGFDFSDAVNASAIGRGGMKWVEGTNQMIDLYKALASYYSQAKTLDTTKVTLYQSRATYFAGLNSNNAILESGSLSYVYADLSGAQVFSDNPYWKTAAGSSVSSTAWVYFSLYGFNPFILEAKPPQPKPKYPLAT